jgi:hypothetical protein
MLHTKKHCSGDGKERSDSPRLPTNKAPIDEETLGMGRLPRWCWSSSPRPRTRKSSPCLDIAGYSVPDVMTRLDLDLDLSGVDGIMIITCCSHT